MCVSFILSSLNVRVWLTFVWQNLQDLEKDDAALSIDCRFRTYFSSIHHLRVDGFLCSITMDLISTIEFDGALHNLQALCLVDFPHDKASVEALAPLLVNSLTPLQLLTSKPPLTYEQSILSDLLCCVARQSLPLQNLHIGSWYNVNGYHPFKPEPLNGFTFCGLNNLKELTIISYNWSSSILEVLSAMNSLEVIHVLHGRMSGSMGRWLFRSFQNFIIDGYSKHASLQLMKFWKAADPCLSQFCVKCIYFSRRMCWQSF
jgi:hypothetical protein